MHFKRIHKIVSIYCYRMSTESKYSMCSLLAKAKYTMRKKKQIHTHAYKPI